MSIQYHEHAPHPSLSQLVRCYWTICGMAVGAARAVNRVLPDGCLDVVLDLCAAGGPRAVVVGAMLEANVIHHTGAVDLLGVRFVPGAAPLFLGLPATLLTGAVVDAADVWRDAPDLTDQVAELAQPADRIRWLDQLLMRKLRMMDSAASARSGMAIVERARGLISVEQLRKAMQVTERTLQRSFAAWVGLTPKQAIRIARFRHALKELHTATKTLASVAHACGYADQAHFTREFRSLAGITPLAFLHEHRTVGFVQDATAARE